MWLNFTAYYSGNG